MSFMKAGGPSEVSDPYKQDYAAFENSFSLIHEACGHLIERLLSAKAI